MRKELKQKLQKVAFNLSKVAADPYAKIRPIAKEKKYVEYDDSLGYWCIFGEKSGFCYGQYASEEEANNAFNRVASILKKAEDIECKVPNLDAMPQSELMAFWKKWHRATKKQAVELVGVRKDADKIVQTLAAYAVAKATAMDLREKGNIASALKYEQHCDIYYDQLPDDCIW